MSKVQSKSKKPVEIEEDSSEEEVVAPKKQVKTTQGAAKAKAPAKKVESSDEESEEEVIKPAAKGGKTQAKATTKAAAKKVESDSEESELEDVKPKAKAAPAKKATPKVTPQIDDSVSDEESEEAPKPKAKAAPTKAAPAKAVANKKAPVVESSEEESEEEVKPKAKAAPVKKAPAKKVESSDEESDEESTPKVAPKKAAAKPAAKKPVESSEEESEEEVKPKAKAAPAKKVAKEESEEEEEEEEEKPAAKAQSKAPAVADDGNYEVFIKGLPFAAAENDIREYFAEAGEIASVNLLKGPDGRSKGIAFVRYANNEGLSTALTYSGMEFGGRQILVEKTTPKGQRGDAPAGGARGGFGAQQGRGGQLAASGDFGPKSERDPNSCSIFVGNLSWGTDENSLAAYFESCGAVQNVRIARDPEGKARGFGHVDFASPDAVVAAVALAGGNLDGRPVRVDYATSKKQDGQRGGFGGGGRGGFGGGFGGGRGGAPGGGRMNLSEEDAGRKKGSISSFQGQKQKL